jgi:hypothetical protein
MIRRGDADPNEEELRQWRRAMCSKLAQGSDWCWIAWIVPLWLDKAIAGYALFVIRPDDDAPRCWKASTILLMMPKMLCLSREPSRTGADPFSKRTLSRSGVNDFPYSHRAACELCSAGVCRPLPCSCPHDLGRSLCCVIPEFVSARPTPARSRGLPRRQSPLRWGRARRGRLC